MKKLTAILNGRKLLDKLFGVREKAIRRKLEAAKDKCEEKKIKAEMEYETAMNRLGDDDVDYESVLNDMLHAKQQIFEAEDTLAALQEIEEDLESEVKPEEKKE